MFSFDRNIKLLRERSGLTQLEFAKLFNVAQQTGSMWESGKSCPDAQILYSISSYFNVTSDSLLGVSIKRQRKYTHSYKKNKSDCEFGGNVSISRTNIEQAKLIIGYLKYQEEKK